MTSTGSRPHEPAGDSKRELGASSNVFKDGKNLLWTVKPKRTHD